MGGSKIFTPCYVIHNFSFKKSNYKKEEEAEKITGEKREKK